MTEVDEKTKTTGDNPEIRGYNYLRMAQACSVVFLAVQFQPALIETAKNVSDGDGRLWGFKAESLIPGVLSVAAVVSALLTPVVGAACDFTPHRKKILMSAITASFAIMLCTASLARTKTSVGSNLILLFAFIVLYSILLVSQTTWLPELTRDMETLQTVNRNGYTILYATEVVCTILTAGVVLIAGFCYVWQGRFAAISMSLTGFLFTYLASRKLRDRAAGHELPEGETSIVKFSFRRSIRLVKLVNKDYPDFLAFLIHVLVSDPAQNGMVTLGSVFMIDALGYKSSAVSIVFGLALISAGAGAALGKWMTSKLGVRRTIMVLLGATCVNTTLAAFVLNKCGSSDADVVDALATTPATDVDDLSTLLDDAADGGDGGGECGVSEGCDATMGDLILPSIFGIFWGLLLAGTWSQQMLLYTTLVPARLEAEFSGLGNCATSLFGWVPPLLMFALNESMGTKGMRWGLFLNGLIMLVGAALLTRVDIDRQREKVAVTLEERQYGGMKAQKGKDLEAVTTDGM